MWDNLEFVNNRLRDTIIRTKEGNPIYVERVANSNGNIIVYAARLDSGERFAYYVEDVDISPVPLGYANTENGAKYLVRLPQRIPKQGLKRSSLCYLSEDQRPVLVKDLSDERLALCIVGEYPCIDLSQPQDPNRSIAFHRDVAIKGIRLYYKGILAGYLKNGFTPLRSKTYLKEVIQGIINSVKRCENG